MPGTRIAPSHSGTGHRKPRVATGVGPGTFLASLHPLTRFEMRPADRLLKCFRCEQSITSCEHAKDTVHECTVLGDTIDGVTCCRLH